VSGSRQSLFLVGLRFVRMVWSLGGLLPPKTTRDEWGAAPHTPTGQPPSPVDRPKSQMLQERNASHKAQPDSAPAHSQQTNLKYVLHRSNESRGREHVLVHIVIEDLECRNVVSGSGECGRPAFAACEVFNCVILSVSNEPGAHQVCENCKYEADLCDM
jgi:hypothetical protein